MRERKLVERAVRISGMFVLLSGMGLQPCLASHSYNAASAGVVQVEQQKQKITGCVLDVTGSPLPGASVLVKGAPGRGAITDMDGNFSVEAEQGEQLEISFIGMETQVVTVSAKTRLQITLKEPFYPHFFNSHQGQKKMFAQIMFVQIASTLPPPLHIPLFIGITDAVEATQKCGSKICFHTVSQTEILTHKKCS